MTAQPSLPLDRPAQPTPDTRATIDAGVELLKQRKPNMKPTAKQLRIMNYIKQGFPITSTLGNKRPVYGCGKEEVKSSTLDSMRRKGLIKPGSPGLLPNMPMTWELA